jgi:hypothetical protein
MTMPHGTGRDQAGKRPCRIKGKETGIWDPSAEPAGNSSQKTPTARILARRLGDWWFRVWPATAWSGS